MERTRNDLEAINNSQKEQLIRYEKRLKDIITAYKGLLKEKEALETSLAIVLNKNEDTSSDRIPSGQTKNVHGEQTQEASFSTKIGQESGVIDNCSLQSQIATLMNSLATLSAEKSRMEASFQADKKVLRSQLQQKDQTISDLQTTIKKNEEKAKEDVENYKAKLIIERQEREKESNNQMLMIRELQKLYADERHLKESIEMQLNNFKMQFANNEAENSRLTELQAQLKEAKTQIKFLNEQKTGLDSSPVSHNSSALLKQLQKEMQQLKEHHAVAIKNEQHRVQLAEEQSRKLAILHENRVANLESRLAELSTSVGTYDRLRQQDQESIQLLKLQIQDLERMTTEHSNKTILEEFSQDAYNENRIQKSVLTNNDISKIVENIMHLKKILLQANARSSNPMDLTNIFSVGADHSHCEEEMLKATQQLEASSLQIGELENKLKQQKDHIATLQEKVKDLNRNIDEQDMELKTFDEKLRLAIREERTKWETLHTEVENDYRYKLNDMEQQLHKQRQRSLQLLDEKEQEIKALQTSFEIFHSSNQSHPSSIQLTSTKNDGNNTSSDGEIFDDNSENYTARNKSKLKSKKLSMGENCHMLHYANEIARKDIEIANLRKAKYQAETSMRTAIHEKVTAQEELNNKIDLLEEQVDRLERCKTREGANLEYLKNVIISYILSKDADGKRHMMNAISAVLQFTPQETQIINETFNKK